MSVLKLYTGDSVPLSITLKREGAAYPISVAATVTAGLRTREGTLVAGPWTADDAEDGADWAAGLVVVITDGSETAVLDATDELQLEVQVVDGEETATWVLDGVRLIKGALP